MAMENSDATPHSGAEDLSSCTKEDLCSSTTVSEEVGDADVENSLSNDKVKDGLDPEGDFVDAEAVGDDLSSMQPGDTGTDSPDMVGAAISNDSLTGDNVNEDDGRSVESFDSALERIAAASAGDPASPKGPSSPFLDAADSTQQNALRQLNLLSSGVSSLDTTLLENASAAEFKGRVAQIAEAHGLSMDSDDVKNILSSLLPFLDGGEEIKDGVVNEVYDENRVDEPEDVSSGGSNIVSEIEEGSKGGDNPKDDVEGGNNRSTIEAKKQNVGESNGGDSKLNHSEDVDALPLEAAQASEVNCEVPANGTEHEKLEVGGSLENGSISGDPSAEIQANRATSYTELEPEVIEWDELNASDDDDDSITAQPQPERIVVNDKDGYGGNVEAVGLHQSETQEAPTDPAEPQKEVEKHGAAVPEPIEVGRKVDHALGDFTEEEKVQLEGDTQEDETMKLDGDKREEEATTLNGDNQEAATKPGEMAGQLEKKGEIDEEKVQLDGDKQEEEAMKFDGGKREEEATTLDGDNEEAASQPGDVAGQLEKKGEREERLPVEISPENESVEATERTADKESVGAEERSSEVDGDIGEVVEEAKQENKEVQGANYKLVMEVAQKEGTSEGNNGKQESLNIAQKPEVSAAENRSSQAAAVLDSQASSANEASSLGGAGPSLPARPAGLGRSVPSLEHAPRAVQRSVGASSSPARQSAVTTEENTDASDGSEDSREKLQMIRVKFLRLAHRLGQSAHNVVVAQVLYRLGLAEQLRGGRTGRAGAFSFERASILAEEQEAAGTDDLEFGCTIMVLGKSGVGKSATINSLFDEVKSGTSAYVPATNKVQEIVGTVHGIKLRVIDTPGLLSSFADQRRNERIMASVKRFIKKSPPDIVLYFDRLDMQGRDYGDLPLLRTITDTFGSAVWFNAIVVLTHASSAPPDGANGVPVSYEMFVAQRSHVVQQTIRQAAGDMRLMNPVSLVENHAACRRNRAGERVLPNGQVWKPQLLLLCFASKILAEANSLLKLQDHTTPAKPFGVRSRVPPLPFLLSSLLQSRTPLKLPNEQMGSDEESEDDSDEEGDSEGEEEYDDLPPFRRLTKEELKLLDKDQRKIYAEELEYREKLFMKKQLKEECARKKEIKRRLAALPKEAAQYAEESYEDENAPASVPVPMPDMALPPSFDADTPTYRYRYLESANQWLVRPVLETHGWDHDSGYDGLNVEKMFVVSKKVPVSVSGQFTKDKKEANLQMECAASFKNGEGKVTHTGLDIQTIGKDLAYTLRSETRFSNFKRNKTTCGLAVTLLGDTVAAGMKIEDRLMVGKQVKLVVNGGALTGRGDVAYGGSLEATLRDKDYPIGQFMSTIGLSVMDWHGDLAIGGNLQVQCKVGKTTVITRGNLNNRRAGQISIRVSSSEQVQMALIGLIPLLRTFINNRVLGSN